MKKQTERKFFVLVPLLIIGLLASCSLRPSEKQENIRSLTSPPEVTEETGCPECKEIANEQD